MNPKISIKIGSLVLRNPVMVASGTFGYGREFAGLCRFEKLGAIVTKTITVNPRKGNPMPRTCETPSGLINSIGLENPGIARFISEKLPDVASIGVPVIVSIASEGGPEEFVELAEKLDARKEVAALELNISCPNVRKDGKRGKLVSQDSKATYAAVRAVRRATKKPLITKLSPNVTDITEIALSAEEAGSDGIALINTLLGMSVDIETRKPRIAMVSGGLSGPAIRPVALRMVWEVYNKIKLPIIGMGGISDAESAAEFIIAGASAVSIGTANFVDPGISVEIIGGLTEYMRKHSISDINDLRGSLIA